MYSQDYDKKMNELLIDKKTYKEIKTDLTKQYQKKNNELIDLWEKKCIYHQIQQKIYK